MKPLFLRILAFICLATVVSLGILTVHRMRLTGEGPDMRLVTLMLVNLTSSAVLITGARHRARGKKEKQNE